MAYTLTKQYRVKLKNGSVIFMPDKLKHDLDILIDDTMNGEMDMLIVIDGKEGSGKSRSARVIGSYCANKIGTKFDQNNIHFNTNDYIKASESGIKGQINIMDESREALNKKRGMSKSNVMFTNWLSENRDKQQVHIILLPAIHDLDNYVALWRMKLLIHQMMTHIKEPESMSGYRLIRGYFKLYENTNMLQQVIYNKGKYGYYAYPKKYKYQRKFKDCEPLNEHQLQEYKEKKAQKRQVKYDEKERISRREKALGILLKKLKEDKGISFTELGKMAGYDRKSITDIINTTVGDGDTGIIL